MFGRRNIARGLKSRPYYLQEGHRFLAEDGWKPGGANIGADGSNLTIAFLSLERAALSARLIASLAKHVPHFAGELLVVDNGSGAPCRDSLKISLAGVPFHHRLFELPGNLGVAGGRNLGMRHVKTEWVMWLDNDIYMVGNPLARIQSDLAELGCHFMSLPLLEPDAITLFAKDGHLYLYLEPGGLRVGGGSVTKPGPAAELDEPGFLSTFLFGGASVANVESFLHLGGYDENALVGFEDIDFSIRLYRAGMKVGTCGAVTLVHDHPAPQNAADRDYESSRFDDAAIRRAAAYFEEKHGFRFWSKDTSRWLSQRRAALGLPAGPPQLESERRPRPKVGLIVDVDNWAFFNIASQLIRLLSDRFEFSLVSMDSIDHNILSALLICADCDLVHCLWRDDLSQLERSRTRRRAAALGYDFATFKSRYFRSKLVTTSVYDHLYLEADLLMRKAPVLTEYANAYSVCSSRLDAIYRAIPGYPPPAAVLRDGVDLRLFQPMRVGRLAQRDDDVLTVGWAGNSNWLPDQDPKGLRTILVPALQALADEGTPVRWSFADRAGKRLPYHDMPDYYASIDVLVCASEIEGTPNPVLEAMACGVPVISTDVGIVPEVLGRRQRDFMLRERSVNAMKEAIGRLIGDRSQLVELSRENLLSIQSWDWPLMAKAYGDFFDDALASFRSGIRARAAS